MTEIQCCSLHEAIVVHSMTSMFTKGVRFMSTRVLTNTLVKRGLKSKIFPPTRPQSSLISLHARYKRPVARRTKTEQETTRLLQRGWLRTFWHCISRWVPFEHNHCTLISSRALVISTRKKTLIKLCGKSIKPAAKGGCLDHGAFPYRYSSQYMSSVFASIVTESGMVTKTRSLISTFFVAPDRLAFKDNTSVH